MCVLLCRSIHLVSPPPPSPADILLVGGGKSPKLIHRRLADVPAFRGGPHTGLRRRRRLFRTLQGSEIKDPFRTLQGPETEDTFQDHTELIDKGPFRRNDFGTPPGSYTIWDPPMTQTKGVPLETLQSS